MNHLEIAADIHEMKDVIWQTMLNVNKLPSVDGDDKHLDEIWEHLDLAFSALCCEAEKHEAEHGKHWDTDIGDY